MGDHARPGTRRAAVVRAALVAVAGSVLAGSLVVGIGSADEPQAAPAAAGAPTAPAVPTTADRAPTSTPGPLLPLSLAGRGDAAPQPEAPVEPAAAPTATAGPAPSPPVEELATAGVPLAAPAAPAPAAPAPSPLVAGTPCTVAARACVDLGSRTAWLIDAGKIARGPVKIMTGDRDTPTPRGTFRVQWKAEQYTSREYLTQMPYSVFFADGGIAFHEGRQDTYSAGCVKLVRDDAVAWFRFLQIDDEVQIR